MLMRLARLTELQGRERLLAVLSGVALLIVLMDRVVLSPWARHSQQMQRQILELEQTLQTHQRLLARKDRVFAELAQYQRYLRPPVADDLQMATLLKEVEEIAGHSGVRVSEIKPLNVETEAVSKRYALEVRFDCTFEEWVDFVTRIESSPSLYTIGKAGLSIQEDTRDRLEGYLRVVSTAIHGENAAPSGEAGSSHVASVR